jgi:hypothetical protein
MVKKLFLMSLLFCFVIPVQASKGKAGSAGLLARRKRMAANKPAIEAVKREYNENLKQMAQRAAARERAQSVRLDKFLEGKAPGDQMINEVVPNVSAVRSALETLKPVVGAAAGLGLKVAIHSYIDPDNELTTTTTTSNIFVGIYTVLGFGIGCMLQEELPLQRWKQLKANRQKTTKKTQLYTVNQDMIKFLGENPKIFPDHATLANALEKETRKKHEQTFLNMFSLGQS